MLPCLLQSLIVVMLLAESLYTFHFYYACVTTFSFSSRVIIIHILLSPMAASQLIIIVFTQNHLVHRGNVVSNTTHDCYRHGYCLPWDHVLNQPSLAFVVFTYVFYHTVPTFQMVKLRGSICFQSDVLYLISTFIGYCCEFVCESHRCFCCKCFAGYMSTL